MPRSSEEFFYKIYQFAPLPKRYLPFKRGHEIYSLSLRYAQ